MISGGGGGGGGIWAFFNLCFKTCVPQVKIVDGNILSVLTFVNVTKGRTAQQSKTENVNQLFPSHGSRCRDRV